MTARAIPDDPTGAVTARFLPEAADLPLVLVPEADIVLAPWLEHNGAWIEHLLVEYGAILFRNFSVESATHFASIARALLPEAMNYVEGSSPRTIVQGSVYTSTEYPPEQLIAQHNELSYARTWPGRLLFFCEQAPRQGGETPLADGRRVLSLLPCDLVERFEARGVRYIRNLHDGRGAGLSWRTVFETDDRSTVEAYCRAADIELHWRDDGALSTRQVRPAVVEHPVTGERTWFNQVDHWHPAALGGRLSDAVTAVYGDDELPTNATHADGTPISSSDVARIQEVLGAASVRFRWQTGDVLLLDNTLMSHGRMPFSGPRRVLVAMGSPVSMARRPCP